MSTTPSRNLTRWTPGVIAIAVALSASTLGFRLHYENLFGSNPTLILFCIPIILSAYWGGLLGGLLATGISILGSIYFLLPPTGSFVVADPYLRWQPVVLGLGGFLISVICESLHRARHRAEIDMAQLRSHEQALLAAHQEANQLRAALDEHAIVAITDSRGKITFVNDKFCALSKYSREELIGQDHRIINSGEHSSQFFRELWSTIKQGRVWQGEIKNRAKDGSHYWVATTIVPFIGEHGQPAQYIAIRADITARKNAEEKLRRSEERLQVMTESLSEGLVLADLDGQVIQWNRAGTAMHGFESAEEAMRRLPDFQSIFELLFLDGEPAPLDRWPLARIIDGEKIRDLELRVRRRDVEWERIFSYSGSRVKQPNGSELAFLSITDITQRKQAELEVQRLNAVLERRVVERTAELETANRELEAFSYSVSHDLRAPLRSVDGFAQAVLEDYGSALPAEGYGYLKIIRESAQKMGQLIDDLLKFSRLSRAPISREPISVTALVNTLWADIQARDPARKVTLVIDELPSCEGDPALLRQVWQNLLSNAFKYTAKNDHARIQVGSTTTPDHAPVYFISDNGIGFDMRYADKLFGVFQRLHRMEDFEGTGVGLAIVHRIIQRHGGRIWAQAEPGKGATFCFTLQPDCSHECPGPGNPPR